MNIIILLTQLTMLGAPTWEVADQAEGITVWRRDVPHSMVREVRATAETDMSAEQVWAVLKNAEAYTQFMSNLEVLKIIGQHALGQYEYQRINPPLVAKRDYTLKVNFETDATIGLYRRSWTIANDRGPKKTEDIVRVQLCTGEWKVQRIKTGGSSVTYYLYTNPGGSIPNWIANRANKTTVHNLMKAVLARSKNPEWTP